MVLIDMPRHLPIIQKLPYIVLFYLFDCLALVKTPYRLFASWFGESPRAFGPGPRLSALLPSGRSYLVRENAFFPGTTGLYALPQNTSPLSRPAPLFFPWDKLGSLSVRDNALLMPGDFLMEFHSFWEAEKARAFITGLARSTPPKRAKMIRKHLLSRMNLDRIKKLQALNQRLLFFLDTLCWAQFSLTFLALPLFAFTPLVHQVRVWPCLMLMGLVYAATMILGFFCHKSLYPGAKTGRGSAIAFMLLSPPSSMRAGSHIRQNLYLDFDALAVAAVLCDRETFLGMARKQLGDIREERDCFAPDLSDWWDLYEKTVFDMTKKMGLKKDDLLGPPAKKDPEAASFCPYCKTEYLPGPKSCADCGQLLIKFSSPSSPP